MSGNGRGSTRQPGRSPPFLVIGLLVALVILGFNYWNLSSSNASLSTTNIDLQDQIRILTSKKLSEEQGKRDVERKYQLLEQRVASKDSEIKHLQEEGDKKQSSVDGAENAKRECEVNLQTCETNNSGIQQQLEEVNKQLEELKKAKESQTAPNCDSQCSEVTKKLYSDMFSKAGAAVMQQLINAGMDIGEDLKAQVQQAAPGGAQQVQAPDQKAPEVKEMSQADPKPADAQAGVDPKKAEENKAATEGKMPIGKGFLNQIVDMKGKIEKKLGEYNPGEKVKQGLDALSKNAGPPLHDLLNRTQESLKDGLNKTIELVGSLQGEGKLHASDNGTNVTGQINDTKNDTLVGNDNQDKDEVKKDGNVTESDPKKPEAESEKLNIPKPPVNVNTDNKKADAKDDAQPADKNTNNDDDGQLYDDDNKEVEDKNKAVEEKKKEEDSIDDLGKNLNKEAQ